MESREPQNQRKKTRVRGALAVRPPEGDDGHAILARYRKRKRQRIYSFCTGETERGEDATLLKTEQSGLNVGAHSSEERRKEGKFVGYVGETSTREERKFSGKRKRTRWGPKKGAYSEKILRKGWTKIKNR